MRDHDEVNKRTSHILLLANCSHTGPILANSSLTRELIEMRDTMVASTRTSPYAILDAVEFLHEGQAAQQREQAELDTQHANDDAIPPTHISCFYQNKII